MSRRYIPLLSPIPLNHRTYVVMSHIRVTGGVKKNIRPIVLQYCADILQHLFLPIILLFLTKALLSAVISPSYVIDCIFMKVHQRGNIIHRCFVSCSVDCRPVSSCLHYIPIWNMILHVMIKLYPWEEAVKRSDQMQSAEFRSRCFLCKTVS